MKLFLIALLILTLAMAYSPINKEIVEEIKRKTDLWTPVEPEDNVFRDRDEDEISSFLGTKIEDEKKSDSSDKDMGMKEDDDFNDHHGSLPTHFDARTEWGDICQFRINDQGKCGSCWAFGAVEILEDRICIKSKGNFTKNLSEQHLVSCIWGKKGCIGGNPVTAFGYLMFRGIPTEECKPYYSGETKDPGKCSNDCLDPDMDNKKYKCKSPWTGFRSKTIKKEIKKNGPVMTVMLVYEDLMNYGKGIYHHVAGRPMGGHAVKIIGWGKQDDHKYWIAANSWSEEWGENGYFRIKEGDSFAGKAAFACKPYKY
ncbi:unnamed protein product [Moneuplotes crassus]|uniref:Peptidase C1A papain C-terminal domain-containing protein n=1 Tax=Euplotes crassus TaxID=5936 RepID=A0AAD1XK13_EUPCR|nr:unnamed protein product [Moneuplotes crassus]